MSQQELEIPFMFRILLHGINEGLQTLSRPRMYLFFLLNVRKAVKSRCQRPQPFCKTSKIGTQFVMHINDIMQNYANRPSETNSLVPRASSIT